MLSIEQTAGFLLAASVVTLAPGPDNMMVLSIGMAKGRIHGIAFGLGCACGCLIHTLLATFGVSAVIAGSPHAFWLLRMCGGAYLVWLGVGAWRGSVRKSVGAPGDEQAVMSLFWKGVLANVMNPKVILFFLSFLPQFVLAGESGVALQVALLGVLFVVQAALIFGLIGYFSGTVGQWMALNRRAGVVLNRLAALVFVTLGVRLLWG
ncbi:MAG TPA: LysE family translocator [Methylophilaceae bacterium]